jgi:hypothetical protein
MGQPGFAKDDVTAVERRDMEIPVMVKPINVESGTCQPEITWLLASNSQANPGHVCCNLWF